MKKEKNKLSHIAKRKQIIGMLFALPWIIGLLVFYAYPLVSSLYYSFTDYSGFNTPEFVGLKNFEELFADYDETFWVAVSNTLDYALLSVPMGLILAFSLALALNVKTKLQGVYRVIAFLPTLVPTVATGIIWQWLMNTQYGLFNDVLYSIFKTTDVMIPWFTDPAYTNLSLTLVAQWSVGAGLLVFLAGLQDVPRDYYEAAVLDGANVFQKFWHITRPLMSPVIFYQLIMGIIGALQQFTLPYVIGGDTGGTLNSMLFYNMKLYNFAFKEFEMGMANAMAWLMFIVIMTITLLLYKTSNKWVHYMGE